MQKHIVVVKSMWTRTAGKNYRKLRKTGKVWFFGSDQQRIAQWELISMVLAVNLGEKYYSRISGNEGCTFNGFWIHWSALIPLIFTLESADSWLKNK